MTIHSSYNNKIKYARFSSLGRGKKRRASYFDRSRDAARHGNARVELNERIKKAFPHALIRAREQSVRAEEPAASAQPGRMEK